MDFLELRIRHMSIDLCGGNRGMSKKLLDSSYVCAIGEEGSGEAVTEGMCRNFLDDIRSERVFLDLIRDKKSCESYICIDERLFYDVISLY